MATTTMDIITETAAATTTKGQAIKIASTGAVVCTAATDPCVGCAVDDAASGDPVAVHLFTSGSVKGIASAAITKGAYVTPTTGGKWVTWSSGAGAKHIARTAAGADGDFFEIISGAVVTA